MTTIYVDAGAWIALAVPRDSHHQEAQSFFRGLPTDVGLVTSNLVLAETYTWLRYRQYTQGARSIHQSIGESERQARLDLVWVTRAVHQAAWEIYERYHDQAFSFCDCTSFVIASREKVDSVFGFDSDFRTMGFDLRPSTG